MKLIIAIVAVLSQVPTTTATYLACCAARNGHQCPPMYKTIDSSDRNDRAYTECCYPDIAEEEQTALLGADHLPECILQMMHGDGPGISITTLLETANFETSEAEAVITNEISNKGLDQGTDAAEAISTSETEETWEDVETTTADDLDVGRSAVRGFQVEPRTGGLVPCGTRRGHNVWTPLRPALSVA